MKARLIHTRFWEDDFILQAPKRVRYLYLYFMTNPRIEMTGIFKASLPHILLETGMDDKEFGESMKYLEKHKKVFMHQGYIYVTNTEKYNHYSMGKLTSVAYKRELDSIDSILIEYFNSQYPIHRVSIEYQYPMDTHRNKKQEIRNKKGKEIVKRKPKEYEPIKEFIEFFNEQSGKEYKITDDRSGKLELRLKKYSMDELKRAAANLLKSSFHTGQDEKRNPSNTWYATPDFILRTDEKVDEWLNAASTFKPKNSISDIINSNPKHEQ